MTEGCSKIWIAQDGQKYGPYFEETIRQWMLAGKLSQKTLAWRSGMLEWQSLHTLLNVVVVDVMPPPFAQNPAPRLDPALVAAITSSASSPSEYTDRAKQPNAVAVLAKDGSKKTDFNRDAAQILSYFKKHPVQRAVALIVVLGSAAISIPAAWDEWNFSATGTPSNASASTSVAALFSSAPNSPQSEQEVISFATGIWTFTKPGELWYRYTIKSDGTFSQQSALPAQDGWGEVALKGHIKPTSGKFSDDGKRWFGFDVIADNFLNNGAQTVDGFKIMADGRLIEYDGAGNPTNIYVHSDVNPFSK